MTPESPCPQEAMVVRTTRRWVTLLDDQGNQREARSSSRAIEVTVGDRVTYQQADADLVIQEILERRNCLERKNLTRSKIFAANVDHLYVVTSVGPLFNTAFIDRALVAAADQEIPVTILLNKIDQPFPVPNQVECYQRLGFAIKKMSAQTGEGINHFKDSLSESPDLLIVFCGLSGVGKSSLLNILVPAGMQNVGTVSKRTGQGKQTTTQAQAFPFPRSGKADLQIVDLPGFSQFGMIHIPLNRLTLAYPEFRRAAQECAFTDCSHIEEPVCGIKQRLETGEIEQFRYQSYLEIRDEIKCARSF